MTLSMLEVSLIDSMVKALGEHVRDAVLAHRAVFEGMEGWERSNTFCDEDPPHTCNSRVDELDAQSSFRAFEQRLRAC